MNRIFLTPHARRALLAVCVIALAAVRSWAADRTWNNAGGGDFGDNAKWTPNFVPGQFDTAIFNLGGYTVNFTANQDSAVARINSTGITFDLTNHAYDVSNVLVGDTANGSLTIDSTTLIGILGTSNVQLGNDDGFNGTLTVNSGATLNTSNEITLGGGGDTPGNGTLVMNGGTVNTNGISANSSSGSLTYTSGNLTVTGGAYFSNGAPVVVNSGTFTLSGSSSFSNGLTANPGGVISLPSGFHSVGGPGLDIAAGGSVTLASGFLSVPVITTGTLGWTGGTVSYGSTLSIGTGGPLGASIVLDDKSLTTGGAITIQSSGSLVVGPNVPGSGALIAPSISVAANGNFEYDGSGSGGTINLSSGGLAIGNPATAGKLTGPADGTTVAIGSGGNITLQSGTMTIDSGYALSLAPGGTLNISLLQTDGTFTYNGGSLTVQDQPLVFDGTSSGSGHINGSDTVGVNESDQIATESSITVKPFQNVDVNGGNLIGDLLIMEPDATLDVGNSGNISINANISVVPSATLNINADGNLATGTLTNTGGNISLASTGSISTSAGGLQFGPAGITDTTVTLGMGGNINVFGGPLSIASGRTLELAGGSITISTFDETSLGTFEFHHGQLSVGSDDLEIGPAGIDGPEPTIIGVGSYVSIAPFTGLGGNISIVSGRTLEVSGGSLLAKSLTVGGTASFNHGYLQLAQDGFDLRVVDPELVDDTTPLTRGISHVSSAVTIGSTSAVILENGSGGTGTVTIEPGQTLHLNGGSLYARSITEEAINGFSYSHGSLFLRRSDLVIGPGNAVNDGRLLGASPVLILGDDVRIEDYPDPLDPPFTPLVYGNTTIESGGSLHIAGGEFYTLGDLTIQPGGSLSGDDINQVPLKAGLGGSTGNIFEPGSVLTNGGDISPGYAGLEIGRLDYNGDYVQTATGDLHLELHAEQFGEFRFTSNDQLHIGGTATLDGTLTITFDFGYAWTVGDTFSLIVTGQGLLSQYDPLNISYPALPEGISLFFNYSANGGNTLQLTVVPEPSGLYLALLAAAGAWRPWRNHRRSARNKPPSLPASKTPALVVAGSVTGPLAARLA